MARVGRQPRRGEHGFGLLEVILSLTVLLLVLVASSFLVDTVVKQAAFNRQRVAAAELAEQYLETTSNATLSSLQANIAKDVLLTPTPVTVGGVNYSVWSHLEWAGTGNAPSLCTSGNPPQVIRATMTVKWGAGQSMGETSIIDPPYGTVIPGDGFLSIQIVGPTPREAAGGHRQPDQRPRDRDADHDARHQRGQRHQAHPADRVGPARSGVDERLDHHRVGSDDAGRDRQRWHRGGKRQPDDQREPVHRQRHLRPGHERL